MPTESIFSGLQSLGFRVDDATFSALCKNATKARMSFVQALEQLVDVERRERDGRNLTRRMRYATLGTVPGMDTFDWNHPRSIDRDGYENLLKLDFVGKAQNVLLRGPSGVGKTALAKNLGLAAIQSGMSVRMLTLAAALTDLLKQESLPATERRLRVFDRIDLLILDEIGYLPCDARAADMLFNIIARRHEKRATVISTNLPFKQWGQLFQGAGSVAALVDRFSQHCHVLDIDGDSWRQTHSLKKQ